MEIIFEPAALEDLAFWKSNRNELVLKKIRVLLENI
jgi:Txe/YoeB family toxin of Txe-Axe toxin-antitoxin module